MSEKKISSSGTGLMERMIFWFTEWFIALRCPRCGENIGTTVVNTGHNVVMDQTSLCANCRTVFRIESRITFVVHEGCDRTLTGHENGDIVCPDHGVLGNINDD